MPKRWSPPFLLLLALLGCEGTGPIEPRDSKTTALRPSTVLLAVDYYEHPAAGSNHSCAQKRLGGSTGASSLVCWGANNFGQIGTGGSSTGSLVPTAVSNSAGMSSPVAGENFTCALKGTAAYCWGLNTSGQLGNGTLVNRTTPVAVAGGVQFVRLTAGKEHACGLTSDGRGYCWGRNSEGQLGTNSTVRQLVPASIYAGRIWSSIDAGGLFTCALETQTNAVYCWGANGSGQLGTADQSARLYPSKKVAGTFSKVTAGYEFSCGLNLSSQAYCWGDNGFYQLGLLEGSLHLPFYTSPQPLGYTFVSMSAGLQHACSTSPAVCWGRGLEGQIGDNSLVTRPRPTRVAGNYYQGEISAGWYHNVMQTSSGSIIAWGQNNAGQIGDGTTLRRRTAVTVLP